jgi:hypothetical protein
MEKDLCDVVVFVYNDATILSCPVSFQVAVKQMQCHAAVMYLPVMILLRGAKGVEM